MPKIKFPVKVAFYLQAVILLISLCLRNAYALSCNQFTAIDDPGPPPTTICTPAAPLNCVCPVGYSGTPSCVPDEAFCAGNERCDTNPCIHDFTNLNFHAHTPNGQPISGVVVTLSPQFDGDCQTGTHPDGSCNYGVWQMASYSYNASKNDYTSASGSVNVGTTDITIDIELTPGCGSAGGNYCAQPGDNTCDPYPAITPNFNCSGTGQKCCFIPPPPTPPVINSPGTANGVVGTAFSYTITATNNPTSFGVTGTLPGGLALNGATIAGTPTAAGTFPVTMSASNNDGSDFKPLTITITAAPTAPVITTQPTDRSVVTGQTATFSLVATGATAYQWERANPGSSTFVQVTGATSASYTTGATTIVGDNGARYRCVASNGVGPTTSNIVTLTVTAGATPVITSPLSANLTVGVPFSYQIIASNNPTSINAFGLPQGLSLLQLNCITAPCPPPNFISGTPTNAGTFNVTLSASNGFGPGISVTLVLSIAPAATPALPQLGGATAYPVPFKPSAGHSAITFNNLLNDTSLSIKIYTISGELVKELHNPSGLASLQWDVHNEDGEPVASGVYIYRIKNADSEKRGKLVIIR